MLHGRDEERARLDALVVAARAGRAGALVVLGDPGVGKSALLDDLVAGLRSAPEQPAVLVLRTAGVATEAPLPFAALHRLLRPVLDRDRLPPPQARALGVAFGHSDDGGVPVEPFLVGVATLSVLTEAADDRPVLCVVDDAHWLDAASADALLFAARQLQADRVAMVFAARAAEGGTGAFRPDSVPVMRLAGLDPAAARLLLARRAKLPPSEDVADRLVAETGGNPLALLELPTELAAGQLAGTAALPPRLVLTERVERAFLDRIRRASPDVQALLLLAAADDTGGTGVLHRAAAASGVGAAAWDEAERAGLLAVTDNRVTVRHPLVRSAVYQAATSLERRHAHAALARALDDDPDRQTWHQAAATIGPDTGVADALHAVGERAQQRGAYRAAADAFERAAGTTAAAPGRAARLFAAARNAWSSGDAVRAGALCADAAALADDAILRADIDRLRGRIEVNVGSALDAHRIFTQAAGRVAARDPVRALEMAVAAAVARSHGIDSGARLPADAIDVDVSAGDSARTRCLKQLLVSTRLDIAGEHRAALTALHRALDTALSAPDSRGDLDLLGNLGNAALHLGDDDAQRRFYALMLSTAREKGDGMTILYALQRLPFGQYAGGQWTALRASCEEAIALGRSVGQSPLTVAAQAWLTLLAALEGRPDYGVRLAALQEQVRSRPPVGIFAQPVADLIRWARGAAALVGGDAAGALHQFRQMQRPALQLMAATDRFEAAVRADDHAQAAAWVGDLEALARDTTLAWVRAGAAFGRALTAQPDAADGGRAVSGLFQEALIHHGAADRPYDRARVQLAYGEFLRRQQRRVDARGQLRAALDTFEDLHAEPFAARAAQELRASGETARKRDPSTQLDLTPMERKVAELVARGLSNKDVAAQCWVSPRTVAFHLRNVFTKLGISSRSQLAQLPLS
ncbi:LuxR family transcriptional regulator [Amorphoplanes nipponensis]|uniref:LuxR family transcriptional regulator n=1 Tax=Actinoplanes nipponensis TaxID=135950 RepID=A0A919JQ96_9ACTN|nr:LuxR family transcriptional regulator [Actinoplanes nipponensis]GIE50979.1 LuxR family transcriptional regulator [Actinoplanes nipponensis]